VHRVALVHRRMLQGRVFQATSPSGRFVDGAAAINGRVLSLIEAHGKNIFYVRSFCYLSLSSVMECFWSCCLAWLECVKEEATCIQELKTLCCDGAHSSF
jgi:hypothetical protein